MRCPKCKADDKEYQEKVIVNLGGKEKYPSVDYRRYVCLKCGYRWKTAETFASEIEIKRKDECLSTEND